MRMSIHKRRRVVEKHLRDGHRVRFRESGLEAIAHCVFCGVPLVSLPAGDALALFYAANFVVAGSAEYYDEGGVVQVEALPSIAS
jgi:hypothetical protein